MMAEIVYQSIHSFCMSKNLRDPNVEECMAELNKEWIENTCDPEALRRHLDGVFEGPETQIRGVLPWITKLAVAAAKIHKPVTSRDGTVFVMKNKELETLIYALGVAYEDIITHELLYYPLDRLALRKLELYHAKVRFLWALLGLTPNVKTFAHFLDRSHHIEIRLPQLIEASVRAKQKELIPKAVVELDDVPVELLTKRRRRQTR